MQQPKNKLNLNHGRSTRELVLICTILKSTLVQEVYVHSFNQDERAQVSAGQRDRQDIINYGRNEIFRFLTYPVKRSLLNMNQLMINLCIGRHHVTVIMKILKCLHNVCQLKISGKDMNRT